MSTAYPPNPANPYPPVQPMTESDQRLWATLIHVGGLFFAFLSPLVGYLVLKDRGVFVRQHAATALNFQFTLLIIWVATAVLTGISFGLLGIILIPIASLVSIAALIFTILAAVAANRGEHYIYPATIKFVS